MKILGGNECAEQFYIWLKDFEEELIFTEQMPWAKVESAMHALTTGKARKEVGLSYRMMRRIAKGSFGAKLWPKEDVKNCWLQDALYQKYTDANRLKLATDGLNKEEMEAFHKICYKEEMYCLQIHFFGNDLFGHNVYRQLKQIIAGLQPDLVKGIKKYKWRVSKLQAMLLYILWEQGMRNGIECPPLIEEEELRDYLCDYINCAQRAYLKQHNHDVYLWTYSETLMFLKRSKDNIVLKQAAIKQQEAQRRKKNTKSLK